jgi:sorbitol-specific phosphotransferase system component IIA
MVFYGSLDRFCIIGHVTMVFDGSLGRFCIIGNVTIVFDGSLGRFCIIGHVRIVFDGSLDRLCIIGHVTIGQFGKKKAADRPESYSSTRKKKTCTLILLLFNLQYKQ